MKESLMAELTVVPVDHERWPADPGEYLPNAYIRVTLDLAAARLAIVADQRYSGPEKENRKLQPYPGSFVHHWDFPVPVPNHMTWQITNHLTSDQAEKLLDLIAAQARVILSELVPVNGRAAGGCDWSLRAAAAVRVISSFTSNWWHALSSESVVNADWTLSHHYEFRGLLDMPDALGTTPELASPEWAVMPDAELDEAAAKLARSAPYHLREQWIDAAHLIRDDRYPTNTPIYLVGVLASLYRLRSEQAGALTPVDASAWFTERVIRLTVVNDDTTDAELAKLTEAEERIAAAEGKRLLGALAYVTAVRTEQRDRIRSALAKSSRSTRAALVLRIDAWADPQDGDDSSRNATLARLAGISRQVVLSLRERAHAVNVADSGDNND